jgi:hypothetical protein
MENRPLLERIEAGRSLEAAYADLGPATIEVRRDLAALGLAMADWPRRRWWE